MIGHVYSSEVYWFCHFVDDFVANPATVYQSACTNPDVWLDMYIRLRCIGFVIVLTILLLTPPLFIKVHTHPQSMNTVIPCNTYHILNTMPPYYTYPQSMYTVIPCNTYHNKSSVNKMILKIINVRRYRRGSKRTIQRNCISIDWILVTHQETSSLGQPRWMARWRGEQEDISFWSWKWSRKIMFIDISCILSSICYSGSKIYTFLFVDIYILTSWSSQVHPEPQSKCVQAIAGC